MIKSDLNVSSNKNQYIKCNNHKNGICKNKITQRGKELVDLLFDKNGTFIYKLHYSTGEANFNNQWKMLPWII